MSTIPVKAVEDLVGHNDPKVLLRIQGRNHGRTVYETVEGGGKNAFTRKHGNGYFLVRDDEGKTQYRWVEAGTKIELLKAPLGLLLWLPGDTWIEVDGQQYDASGCVVEIVDVVRKSNKRPGRVIGWVRSSLEMSAGEAKHGHWGELDSHITKSILAGDFDKEMGETGKAYVVSRKELRTR